MSKARRVDVIIPALDEAGSIGVVVKAIPEASVRSVIVVDNGSRDATADVARRAGAIVVHEPRRGYGSACLAGIRALPKDSEIVVFMDADGSDDPALLPELIDPILCGAADLVIGSRELGQREPGALTAPQRIGNFIAASWLRYRFDLPATDLGPFRAIRTGALVALRMTDPDFGWTIEMQVKAARRRLKYVEIAVPARARSAGTSKLSGTVRGAMGAAAKIIGMLAWHDLLALRST